MALRQPRSRTLERAENQGPQLPNASADTSLELWGS
ncbi:hypothetical protein CGLO_09840 [Colletotrichum gloeosporioides Cg-14]|uniref:Uncharacterized protein n=1 Tax=Colletotrichum gloeosporioides (strain Cg-14) TaxID=1237896 RepID=T0LGF5_COLGC|nr:hypothetical protein CGLO_09840 [Colletotrichum gloeosporioides Cg-14]